MAPRHPHIPQPFATAGVPAVIPFVFGDVNTSPGVIGLVLAIILLVAVLLAMIVIEVAGEHRQNVANRRDHHR